MKAMILAGGFGTRISEESIVRPKPMVEIGHKPILWHIMKIYSAHGINDFVICCGYKGHMIKEWFSTYRLHHADVTFDMGQGSMTIHNENVEPWKVTLVDTGENTMTGGRIKLAAPYLDDEPFLLTYGDGVSDVDITALIKFHHEHGRLVTMTAVQPEGRFGIFTLSSKHSWIDSFKEKPKGDGAWANGGFFVLDKKVINYIKDENTIWEQQALQSLASSNQIAAFRHDGFWMAMDTLRDKNVLEDYWQSDNPPWKCW
jgi:glucose-1-phosphate cytidylyltransferase